MSKQRESQISRIVALAGQDVTVVVSSHTQWTEATTVLTGRLVGLAGRVSSVTWNAEPLDVVMHTAKPVNGRRLWTFAVGRLRSIEPVQQENALEDPASRV